jgi:signal transduction histidine kinase/DNA-binding response OmpR family regulator
MPDLVLQNQRLRKLAEVVERIASVRDFAALMNVLRPAIREVCGADGATLVLNDSGQCHYVDEDAIGPLWKGQRFPLEACISGWAMIHAQPAVIEDIYADPRIPHDAYRPTFVKSLSMVPVGRAAPVAAIGCYWSTRHRATAEELELQQALADAMSVGLTNVTLYQNLERRMLEHTRAEEALAIANRQLQADLAALEKLQELSALFVREGDIRPVLEKMVDVAMDFSGADFGTIQLVDPDTGDLRLVAHRNFPSWWTDFWETVAHGEGTCGAAMQSGRRIIVEDVERSPIFVGTPALDMHLRAGVRAVQTTPLASRAGKLLGMFSTHYKKTGRPNERALNLIDLLARQTADIIDRGQLNEALARAKSAAEAANHAKSAFLANMSHEIRTPLHVIIGSANLLGRDVSDPKKQVRVNQLLENSEHLLAVINDVLELSKIEAQSLSVDHDHFVLDGVVARVRRMLEMRVQEKGLELKIELAAELQGLAVVGDVARLTQVLINLCTNAIKFTHRGSVTLRLERLADLPQGVRVGFSIEDTGIGIAPEDMDRIFQPFEQVDPSLSRKYGGSGLGLAICQRLVRLMGGEIKVRSEMGNGSAFSFELVLRRGAGVQTIEIPSAAIPGDFLGARILVAEDHPQSQEILLDMLDELGCVGDIATDGVEALDLAANGSYDAILMDMHMPNMDGLAATRAIRALRQHARTPIIALTANAFAEDRQRCLDAGMDDHLSKPVTPGTLAAALGKRLPHASAGREAEPQGKGDLARTLVDLPGLSVPSMWLRSDDHALQYHAQLLRFAETQAADLQTLHRHLLAGEYELAYGVAHRLKGIAGLLGATRVEALAHQMGQVLRNGRDKAVVPDLAAECSAELGDLAQRLREVSATPA